MNKDAASRLTGIAAFTQNKSAQKGAIVSSLLEMAGLTIWEGIFQELKPYRIQRDNNYLQAVLEGIADTMNPFTVTDDNLYCLTTGHATSADVTGDLLAIFAIFNRGNKLYEEFVSGCIKKP